MARHAAGRSRYLPSVIAHSVHASVKLARDLRPLDLQYPYFATPVLPAARCARNANLTLVSLERASAVNSASASLVNSICLATLICISHPLTRRQKFEWLQYNKSYQECNTTLANLQARDIPIAYWGKYHAQFNFAGRLIQPLELVENHTILAWAKRHPEGRIVVIDQAPTATPHKPEIERLFRGAYVKVWRGRTFWHQNLSFNLINVSSHRQVMCRNSLQIVFTPLACER